MRTLLFVLALAGVVTHGAQSPSAEAKDFLEMYNRIGGRLMTVASEAQWKAATDVKPEHTGQSIGAMEMWAAFAGNTHVIDTAQELLKRKKSLDPVVVRQLETILLTAADYPGTEPELVAQRVGAEGRAKEILDGFDFMYTAPGAAEKKKITPNQIEELLQKSTNMDERRRVWETSKQPGAALRTNLVELQKLRNQLARKLGHNSFFALQVADYGMPVGEMMATTEKILSDARPLYEEMHCWAKHTLAQRYGQPVPKMIPAHWIPNRWAQQWPGLVSAVDLDANFKSRTPEWIVEQAERFYTSLGWPKLPEVFWKKSDLYELAPDATRKKNTHASAWHMDMNLDVRSLMSVRPNFEWLQTTHHELGHIYYYLAYSTPKVPLVLRAGANRAFHEAIGDLIGIAAGQRRYLNEIGILDANTKIDTVQYLLNEAMDTIIFIPWSAGVMTRFEHDLYEKDLAPGEYNKRWWQYVAKYQGIVPPEPRGEEFCDAATKTHIIDDPAQYYDYALAFAIKYQLHMHIAKRILKQDPHNCSYYGNKEVGDFLWKILKLGKTEDWRKVMRDATGQEISAQPMLEYFAPVMKWLQEQNRGREVSWN